MSYINCMYDLLGSPIIVFASEVILVASKLIGSNAKSPLSLLFSLGQVTLYHSVLVTGSVW